MKCFSKLLTVLCLALFAGSAVAANYNFITPDEMKAWIDRKQAFSIVDIQVEKEFALHHLPGSIATYAYPVKTDEERSAIAKAVEQYGKDGNPIVVVCPRGAGGAQRCYDYLKENNIPEEKLTILKGGIEGWPYKELLISGK